MALDELMLLAMRKIANRQAIKTIVVGTAVNVTDESCTVQRDNAPDLLGVRLNAVAGTLENYATIIPKENAYVLAAIIENQKTEAFIICCSEIEKIKWQCGATVLEFDAEGYVIQRNGESLKAIINDLAAAILQLTVTTGTGPSGTPINASAFTDIQNRLNHLFK